MIATGTTTGATLELVTRFESGRGLSGDRRHRRSLKGVDVLTVRDGTIAEKLTYGTLCRPAAR
jgi:hypothetical protein